MKIKLFTALAALNLMLAACGGSDGGIASAPAPVSGPSPTPTPSPTPSPAPAQDFSGQANSALAITSASQSADPPFVQNSGSWGDALKITREADGGYSITVMVIEDSTLGFNAIPVQLIFPVSSRTNATGNPNVFQFASGAGSRNAALEVNLNGAQHVKFATLHVCNKPGGTGCNSTEFSRTHLIFGTPTPLGEIPLGGSASYSGYFNAPSTTTIDVADGNIALNVDFASRGVTGTLTNVGVLVGDFGVGIPDMTLSGQVANTGLLSGNLIPGAGSKITGGSWAANFFGPNAAEIGGTIQLNGGPAISNPFFTGTFGAIRN